MLHKVNRNDRPRRRIEAEENTVLDVQFAILDILRQEGIAKEELAARLGVSKARISQLFGAGANPTLKQVARIFDALDREVKVLGIRYADEKRDTLRGQFERSNWNEIKWSSGGRKVVAANENYFYEDARVAA